MHSCALFPPSLLFGSLIYSHESCPTFGNLELVKELVAKPQRNVPSAGIWRLFRADPRPAQWRRAIWTSGAPREATCRLSFCLMSVCHFTSRWRHSWRRAGRSSDQLRSGGVTWPIIRKYTSYLHQLLSKPHGSILLPTSTVANCVSAGIIPQNYFAL